MKRLFIRLIYYIKIAYYKIKCKLFSLTPIQDNLILFDSYAGTKFNDNPFALFCELKESSYKLSWALKDSGLIKELRSKYPNITFVRHHSLRHFYLLNKSKYWVFNYKTPSYFNKKANQIYLQTWHGIPLKKLGNDIEDNNIYYYRSLQSHIDMIESYTREGQKCDYFITPSLYSYNKLSSAFKLDECKCLKYNYPRNVELLNYNILSISAIKLQLELPLDKKIILYAPTYRDNSRSLSGYTDSYILNFNYLESRLKEDYIILYRPHYLIKDCTNVKDFVYNVKDYQNINDLYLISDCLITDYSSVYFDYSILQRPIYYYMPDIIEYSKVLRGFYINIETDLSNDYHTDIKRLVDDIINNVKNNIKQDCFYKNNTFYRSDNKGLLDKIGITINN